jgi:hypothetical protein
MEQSVHNGVRERGIGKLLAVLIQADRCCKQRRSAASRTVAALFPLVHSITASAL